MKPVPTKQFSRIILALGMTTVMAGCSTVTDYIHSIHGDQYYYPPGYKSTENSEYIFEEHRIGGKTICSARYKTGAGSNTDMDGIMETVREINKEHKVEERCATFKIEPNIYTADNFWLFLDQRSLPSRCGLFYGDSPTPDNVTEEIEWELASKDLFYCRYLPVRDMEIRPVLK